MRKQPHSSGNPATDRTAGYAEALAAESLFAEAADVMEEVLARAPQWAAGWNNLGRYREETGDIAGAIEAWQRSASLDPQGCYGAALKLVVHGAMLEAPATSYVETLFDDYAPRFERSLVDQLDYRVPKELAPMFDEAGFASGGTAIDLGCGTGLMGLELRSRVRRLEGVDLSEAMLAEARRKRIYDRLVQADLMAYLGASEPASLVSASDVLNYVGPLPPVLAAVHQVLEPGGLFGFSLERHDGPEPVLLRKSLRYAHNVAAATLACLAAGFKTVALKDTAIRRHRDGSVPGVLLVVRKL